MNSAVFSASELAAATGGEWLGRPAPGRLGVFTDTRQAGAGLLFVSLAGERFDAHDFLDQAVAAGAGALCVRRDRLGLVPKNMPCLAVADTLLAYQNIAAFHRRRYADLRVIGVTGSVGKTSVKEMLAAICRAAAGNPDAVLATIGNTNNQIGVAQNLLRLNSSHVFAVIEMGTSAPGEIAPLSRMAAPDAAVVNTVAPCHLERLGDLDGVAHEKGAIFGGLRTGGTAVIPENLPQRAILEAAAGNFSRRYFGGAHSDCRVEYRSGNLDGSVFQLIFSTGERFEVNWALTGAHQALNAAAAAAAALALGIAPGVIAGGLAATTLPGMRMKKTVLNGVTYINDAYNANPASMKAALDGLRGSVAPEKLVLALGGMRELGESSEAAHRELIALALREFPGARIVAIGPEFPSGIVELQFTTSAAAAPVLAALVKPGSLVFAKGSRGNAVEMALPPEAR